MGTEDKLDGKDRQDPRGPATPFTFMEMGEIPSLNFSTTTVGVENSL